MKPTIEKRLEVRKKPSETAIMFQKWRSLLFLHWSFDPEVIQNTLPKGLFVDTFNNRAYIGIVPFFITDLRMAIMPSIPNFSRFLELNMRTYVYDQNGTPGVWFYSLDINSAAATLAAR